MWGENSPCYEMDNLVIHNHRQLFITLLVCTRDFIETVWDFAFIPWRANFLSRMPQKFWQLVVLLLPLQEMNELMRTDKRNCLLFPWRLTGQKASCFPNWTGSWTMPWYQWFSHSHLIRPQQLSLFGKADISLSDFTSRPELARLLLSDKISRNTTSISLQVFPQVSPIQLFLLYLQENKYGTKVVLETHPNHGTSGSWNSQVELLNRTPYLFNYYNPLASYIKVSWFPIVILENMLLTQQYQQ